MSATNSRRRLCAHADDHGQGMHWLAPGQTCPVPRPDQQTTTSGATNTPRTGGDAR